MKPHLHVLFSSSFPSGLISAEMFFYFWWWWWWWGGQLVSKARNEISLRKQILLKARGGKVKLKVFVKHLY